MFPSTSKNYLIESSVASRFDRDYLSSNSSLYNGHITDSFIEFQIPGADNELLDLGSLCAEVKIRVTRADGVIIDNTDEVALVDGFFHRMFQSHSVFLNGVQVEGSNNFGLLNNIKTYTSMGKGELDGKGVNMMYKGMDSVIVDSLPNDYFTAANSRDVWFNNTLRDTIHMIGPLNFDIGACNTYMLDNVDLRIRLELSKPSVVLLAAAGAVYKYMVDVCKLWVTKIVPVPGALLALNKTLALENKSIEYMFDRPIVKTIVFPANQTSLAIDSPFGGIVPHRLLVFMIDQSAVDGAYNRNPNYFLHNNISDLTVDINGNTLSNVKVQFPNLTAQAFHQTLCSIGSRNNSHLLTRANFSDGRTLFIFDTRPTEADDVLNLEKRANIRFTLNCTRAATSNKIVYLVGYTLGIIHINSARGVFPNYLQ